MMSTGRLSVTPTRARRSRTPTRTSLLSRSSTPTSSSRSASSSYRYTDILNSASRAFLGTSATKTATATTTTTPVAATATTTTSAATTPAAIAATNSNVSNISNNSNNNGPTSSSSPDRETVVATTGSVEMVYKTRSSSPAPGGNAATIPHPIISAASSSDDTNAMTQQDFERLDSLVEWLQTFHQYDYQPPAQSPNSSGTDVPPMNAVELLSQAPVATIVLRVTEEILDREVTSPASTTVESIWAQVFSTLSSPKLLQKMAGRRLCSTELRFVLLCALLSTSVHPTCDDRITYINRIMTLSKPVQHSLMTLIESFPKTPNKAKSPGRFRSPARPTATASALRASANVGRSPGRRTPGRLIRTPMSSRRSSNDEDSNSVAETPRSSNARRRFPADTNNCFLKNNKNNISATKLKMFPEEPDLLALMGWIRSFPQLHGLGSLSQLEVLNDVKVSLAILHVAEHVCDQPPSPPAFSSAGDTWAAMENAFNRAEPKVTLIGKNLKNMTMEQRQLTLLSGLLCYAVSDSSIDRKTHVAMILSLPRDMQQRLMKLIEAPMGGSDRTVSSITESNMSRRSREEGSPPSGYTPARKKRSPDGNAADDALFSPAIGLDRMVQDLKEQNHQLQKQLEQSTTREAELAIRMQDLESKVRRDLMRIEANNLRKADEAHEAHAKELTELRDELFALQAVRAKEEKAQHELASLKDEMDLMEHTKEKLADTEEKLRKCKERLEQLADLKESLKREEDAHSASVEECLRLDNELKSLQPLRRQLEEYKARTIDAEFKLVECQDELKEMSALSANLNSTHSDLKESARLQQEEADGLRLKLSKDEDDESVDEGLGDGISELNPQVKEELLRLRNENVQLKEFRAKREADGVQRLEEQLDDIQRLSDRFKEQYLFTKKELESTSLELESTKGREEQLKEDVATWTSKFDDADQLAKSTMMELVETETDLQTTQKDLESAELGLDSAKDREVQLEEEVSEWTCKFENADQQANSTMLELESTALDLQCTRAELESTALDLESTKGSEKQLKEDVAEWSNKFDNMAELVKSSMAELESTALDLKSTLQREEDLKQEVVEWITKGESMDKLAQEVQEQLDQTKQQVADTMQLLEESKLREEGLTATVEVLNKEKEEITAESEQHFIDLTTTKEELDSTLVLLGDSQERETELHKEVDDVERKLQEEQERSAGFENELNLTADELETTKAELNETVDREKTLRSELFDMTASKKAVDQQLVDEKEAYVAKQSKCQRMAQENLELSKAEAKKELEELQANMNLLLEGERAASKTKLQQSKDDYQELFEKSTTEYIDLQNRQSTALDATISDYDARIARLKDDFNTEMEAIKSQADDERNKLISKGKTMMKDTKGKAEEIIRELEDELHDTKETLSDIRKEKDEFEHKTRAKVTSYKHKLQFSASRINELSQENDQLVDTVHEAEKEKAKVLEENERYRRQLGGRYGADGKNQNQMDMLQKEFNAILEENRNLKRKLASSSGGALGAISESKDEADYGDSTTGKPYSRGGVSGSTLSALREEYEEQIQGLNDEKRELVMRNSAAITDVQKAEQRAWEMEKDIERLKEELTSAHLALQRAELHMDDVRADASAVVDQSFFSAREESFVKDTDEDRRQFTGANLANQASSSSSDVLQDQENSSPLLVDLHDFPVVPTTPTNVLSPSNRRNESASPSKKSVSFVGKDLVKPLSRSVSTDLVNASMTSEGPSLMELTQQTVGSQDGQPECKQS